MHEKKVKAFRLGLLVFVALLVLTVAEYFVSVAWDGPFVSLSLIALTKAALIAYYFMHIYRLWRTEESH